MCLIALSWNPDSTRERLMLAGNRDEFYARATASAHWWPDAPQVFAGKDLEGGGTWMGVTRNGRFATVTNFRAPTERNPTARSRGSLVSDFLLGDAAPADYLASVAEKMRRYNGFNLLVGELYGAGSRSPNLWYYGSKEEDLRELRAGSYSLSNALLNTPWPKSLKLLGPFTVLNAQRAGLHAYLDLLSDVAEAADCELPQTGLSAEWEKRLSAIFIRSPQYGTRSSTVLRARADGQLSVLERSYDADGIQGESHAHVRVDLATDLPLSS
jgi:uncharacterized protein with NRDE domain